MAQVIEQKKKEGIEPPSVPICTPVEPFHVAYNHSPSTNIPTNPLAANCSIPNSVMEGRDSLAKTHSFTLNMSASEDFKTLMESLPAGKPVAVSNFTMNIRRGGPIEARATTVNGDVLTFNNLHLDIPEMVVDDDLPDTVAAIWSPEFLARFDGPQRRGHADYERIERVGGKKERKISGEAILWNPKMDEEITKEQNRLFPSVEKMMDVNRILKEENDRWISFKQATGHWDTTIENAIKGNKKAIHEMTKLSNSGICVLGTAWKGMHWNDLGNDGNCKTCAFLGTTALRKFTSSLVNARGFTPHVYYPTKMEAYEEYKIMFEYHWNTCHANSH